MSGEERVNFSLAIPLVGPMQSWSTSRHRSRPTERAPTKCGVIGIIAASLGLKRNDDISELASLRMGVRVDEPGVVLTDLVTAQDVLSADGERVHPQHKRTLQYLADAAFLVALEGDYYLLEEVHAALAVPTFPVYLGRRGYYPSSPPFVIDGLKETPLEEVVVTYPHVLSGKPVKLRNCYIEGRGKVVYDQPVSLIPHSFGPRRVYRSYVDGGQLCTLPS